MAAAPSSVPSARPRPAALVEWGVVLALAAVLAASTLALGGFLAETMAGISLAVFALGVVAVIAWVLRGTEALEFNWALLLPVPFLLFALASVLWIAPARWLAWREWLLWFQAWIVFGVTLHVGRDRRQTWTLVGTLALLGLTGVFLAAYQRLVDPDWLMLGRTQFGQFRGRSAGFFGIPNSLAGFFELVVPACLTILLSRAVRPGMKVVSGWLAGLYLIALVLTGSRGGWIALSLVLLLWPVLVWTRNVRHKVIGILAVTVLLSVGLWSVYQQSDYARARIQPFLEGKWELSRPIVWRAALGIWHESPWIGTGAASFGVHFERYRPRAFHVDPVWTHNDYLNILSDYGVVGLGLAAGAGAWLLWLGWRSVRYARRAVSSTDNPFLLAKWKLGLLLGLLAFVLHLIVDFHTRIPGLAFTAAIVLGLLLRDNERLVRPVRRSAAGMVALVLPVALVGAGWMAWPLYRAEGLRFHARRTLEQHGTDSDERLADVLGEVRPKLAAAVRMDPHNGQAWADLAYATVNSWRIQRLPAIALGRYAELAADRALAECPLIAEFWLRKGVALDLQPGRDGAEECFRRALALAPNSRVAWYYYAVHLHRFPERAADALKAVDTCLALDPFYRGADSLRKQMVAR